MSYGFEVDIIDGIFLFHQGQIIYMDASNAQIFHLNLSLSLIHSLTLLQCGRSKYLWNINPKHKWGKHKRQEQELNFHYLLHSSLGTQLVSALCGPGIFIALASPFFIMVFLSSRLPDCDARYLW